MRRLQRSSNGGRTLRIPFLFIMYSHQNDMALTVKRGTRTEPLQCGSATPKSPSEAGRLHGELAGSWRGLNAGCMTSDIRSYLGWQMGRPQITRLWRLRVTCLGR